jgi:hypothetical protein
MELRLVLTVDDFDAAVELYRDTLGPAETPWRDLNVRLQGPAGVQLTLFQPLD